MFRAAEGSDGSAACGGNSDMSKWLRSAKDEGVRAEDIRRAPQQDRRPLQDALHKLCDKLEFSIFEKLSYFAILIYPGKFVIMES